MSDTYLTIEDVAEKLQVSRRTVVRLIELGQLTVTRVASRVRIAPEDLHRYLASRRASRGEP
jgi:excisionase family DNA binding protein